MDDFELDWDDDDMFGGDIDFNDDFDMDPYKNKGFFAGAMDGFLSTVVDNTVGSSQAIFNTARTYLPDSFTTGLDRLSYLKDKGEDLIREFKEGNYESVKSLQSIAKSISARIKDENSVFKSKLDEFSTKDFSDWEKASSGHGDDLPSMEQEGESDVSTIITSVMEKQTSAFASIGDGINQMAAQVGGRVAAGVMAGNKELIGIQSGIKDLLDYQRRVQAKLDQAKITLLAKTYVLHAKFYKFVEKGIHAEIKELRKIVVNSGMSDYQKTSNVEAAKGKIRDVIFERAGGLTRRLTEMFGKEGREEKYNSVESTLGNIASMLEMGEGMNPSMGMAGTMVGGLLGDVFLRELPRFFSQGPFKKFTESMAKRNPELAEKFTGYKNKVTDFGNNFSFLANAAPGMLEEYAENWEDLDEYKYATYEEYVDDMESKGKKPMNSILFKIVNGASNYGKSLVNNFMRSGGSNASGSRYILKQRDGKELAKVGIWTDLNNVTLTDVIPGLLRLQYESLEKIRTGDDSFKAPIYSFKRGEFVSSENAKKVLRSDVFNYSSYSIAGSNARELVNKFAKDEEGNELLSKEDREAFTRKLLTNIDQGKGFNPYTYIDGIGSENEEVNKRIGDLIRERFGITEENIKDYKKGNGLEQAWIASTSLKGEGAALANDMARLAQNFKDSIPQMEEQISAARAGGNTALLREMGLIKTVNGRDEWDNEAHKLLTLRHTLNPEDPTLKGQIDEAGEIRAGETISRGGVTRRDVSDVNRGARHINDASKRLTETQESTTKALNDVIEKMTKQFEAFGNNIAKVDFSQIHVDLGTIPDTLSSIRDIVEKMQAYDSKQESLLEQIAGCVCRQAGGWGKLKDNEKRKVNQEEEQGKKSILDRLKAATPRNLFNKGVETLLNNQPLILGGMLGGLGMLAFHDPKAALLVSGGVAAAHIYRKLGDMARGRNPDNDEDILDENGDVILKASKLQNGDYYDAAKNTVIKEWKEIKGAVFDISKSVYITLSELTGKLFGRDGRAIILSGLDKVKDALTKVWKKVDIFGRFGEGLRKGKEFFYQQDVYVKGNTKEPVLTRKGFQSKKYYCYNLKTKEPFLIEGWDKIDGPVYELDDEGNLNQIVSEKDIAIGLITSAGYSIDKLGGFAKWSGEKLLTGLGKAKDYGLEKAGIARDKIKDTFKTDFTGVEDRLDRIYMLLCDQFKLNPNSYGLGDFRDHDNIPKPSETPKAEETPIDELVNSATAGVKEPNKAAELKQDGITETFIPEESTTPSKYPERVRLNSLEDQEIKKEKEEVHETREDIADIAEYARQETGKSKKKGKSEDDENKPKSLLGKIAGALFGLGAGAMKFMKNPIGFLAESLISMTLKSSMRLAKIGGLMFKGVLGVGSPIYKLLGWGFTGMMWGLKKLLLSGLESMGRLGGALGLKRKGKGGFRLPRLGGGKARLIGTLFKTVLGGAAAYGGYKALNAMGVEHSDRDILKDSENEFARFYDDSEYSDYRNKGLEIEDAVDVATTAATAAAGVNAAKNLGQKFLGDAAGELAQDRAEKLAEKHGGGILNKAGNAIRDGGVRAGEAIGGVAGKALGTAAKVAGGALRVGSRAIPLLGQAMMALDGIEGFTDKEEIGKIFNTNVINGRQRLANGITNILDMGGLVSGGMNWLADATGLDFLKPEGGMTRAIDGLLSIASTGPLKYFNPIGWLSMWETEVTQPQNKYRLAMYGVADPSSELGRAIGMLEYQLDEYVQFGKDRCWLSDKTPLNDILGKFIKDNPKETLQWYKLRFLPVYLTYQSGLRMVGYKSIQEFDKSTTPSVLKVIEQVGNALSTVQPYPLDVDISFDKDIPIMGRQETEGLLQTYMKELKESIKDENKDMGKDGMIKTNNSIKTVNEVKNNVHKEGSGWFSNLGDKVNSIRERADEALFARPPEVMKIDISDLHKDGEDLDNLTIVRLAAYGNDEDKPYRVDAVLTLERYCEKFASVTGGIVKFTGDVNAIYNLFKTTFRNGPKQGKEWVKWFNQRFLPVFKLWYGSIYHLRRVGPEKGWKTISDTNRYDIATELVELKTRDDDGKETKIWDVEYSPFENSESTDDSDRIKPWLTNLETKMTEQRIKYPDIENKKSEVKDLSSGPNRTFTKEEIEKTVNQIKNGGSAPTQNVNQYNIKGSGSDPAGSSLNQIDGGGYETGSSTPAPPPEKTFDASKTEAEKTIIKAFVKNGVKDPKLIAFGLANAKAETNFEGRTESLKYSPEGLLKTFGKRFANGLAQKLGYNKATGKKADEVQIANVAYGRPEMGNTSPGDGWKYRGRGFTQLTFKNNYKKVGELIGKDLVNNPEKVAEDLETAAASEVGFFKMNPAIGKNVSAGNIQRAAWLVGKEERGITRKQQYYPSYLQRLTQGDLKSYLSGVPEEEVQPSNPQAEDAPNGVEAQAAGVTSEELGTTSDTSTETTAPDPNQAVKDAIQRSPEVQGANNVNVPSPAEDGSTVSPDTTPVPIEAPVSNSQSVSTPSTTAESTPASTPVQAPVEAPAPTPVEKPKPTPVKEEPVQTSSMPSDGIVRVSDEGVVRAIATLSESILKAVSSSGSLTQSRKVNLN